MHLVWDCVWNWHVFVGPDYVPNLDLGLNGWRILNKKDANIVTQAGFKT